MRMDRQQLPNTSMEPDIPAQVTEVRAPERAQGHDARNQRGAIG